jgi:hypothetical protein
MLAGWMDAVYIPTVCPVLCHPTRIQPCTLYSVQVYIRGDQVRQLSQLELSQMKTAVALLLLLAPFVAGGEGCS